MVLVVFTVPAFERWAAVELVLTCLCVPFVLAVRTWLDLASFTEVLLLVAVVASLVRLLYLGSAAVTPFALPIVVFEGLE